MNRNLLTVVCLATSVVTPTLANSLGPEPETFHPNAPIIWAATNVWPENMRIYQTVETNFSQMALSNAMAMGAFKPINITSQKREAVVFEVHQDTALMRSLKISSTQGSIDYLKSQTDYSSVRGVPSFEATVKLAMSYLQRFDCDTNQIIITATPMEGTVETYAKKNGPMVSKVVYERGTTFYRQLDGIKERDSSFMIYFGNDASVNSLHLNWQVLRPCQFHKTASLNEIISLIKSGRATIYPAANGEQPIHAQAKTFTITKITPIYVTRGTKELVYPSADLEIIADVGTTNASMFYLNCPLVDETSH